MPRVDRRRVVALAYDRPVAPSSSASWWRCSACPGPSSRSPWYRFEVCSLDRGPLRATGGVTLRAARGPACAPRARARSSFPAGATRTSGRRKRCCAAVRAAHARGARLVTICSGVFVLAAAGLLDGRRATTHWRYVERLRARYPRVRVEPDVLYVDDGTILTSAGSAAGIDLCLHVVRRDYGAEIANQVARRLVVSPQREGGQSQYVPLPVGVDADRRPRARARVGAAPPRRRRCPSSGWARQAAMSPRTFARRFRDGDGHDAAPVAEPPARAGRAAAAGDGRGIDRARWPTASACGRRPRCACTSAASCARRPRPIGGGSPGLAPEGRAQQAFRPGPLIDSSAPVSDFL